ncbi:PREDICTED: probable WRKY transcription factor 14 [Nicotiana attenuata]|uniref:Wrky transcription factor 14 n=1 Tax=Nicotiana attenuata TaxID=49451 RepID=A0A1J6HVI9_NICAT|nr:PREDICTED: probable WRKY transcription factor 14 [Nicotiana attenuata]OIS96845.1 putative wrky transcription factor 14 [Nicotiana attenuata]
MCSKFQLQKTTMENNYQGDLADIFLGSSGQNISGANNITTTSGESSSTVAAAAVTDGWLGQFPSHPINYSTSGIEEPSVQDFGDPFCNLRDPLFHDLDMMPACSSLFTSNNDNNSNNNNNTSLFEPKILEETEMKSRPTGNIFSRMLQISPTTKLAAAMSPCNSPMTAAVALQPSSTVIAGGGALVANDAIISPNSSKTCLVENSGLQISSPRNTGIKRRKSQAKKVVCIPAPAPANSRQGGEIVPSDLWAWRKYGQKPIKGSPYPRGYYRCSSSKGCSARKQVERSRTDPNMLVITYTSEHNHPWPTQRNALAGSTRSQPNNSKHTTTSTSKNNTNSKDDEQNTSTAVSQVNISKVKEEVAELQDLRHDHHHHQQLAVEMRDIEFSKDSYQPILPDSSSNNSHEDFFADLVELEADPLNLLFAKTLSEDINEAGQKKAIDAFNLYDWSGNNNNKSQADP